MKERVRVPRAARPRWQKCAAVPWRGHSSPLAPRAGVAAWLRGEAERGFAGSLSIPLDTRGGSGVPWSLCDRPGRPEAARALPRLTFGRGSAGTS